LNQLHQITDSGFKRIKSIQRHDSSSLLGL
jgi:hypothetical protein